MSAGYRLTTEETALLQAPPVERRPLPLADLRLAVVESLLAKIPANGQLLEIRRRAEGR